MSTADDSPTSAQRDSSPRANVYRVVAIVAIGLAVALAYWNSSHVPFFFDDRPGIERNESIRHLWPLSDVLHPPVTAAGAAGRPVVNLSLAANYAWGGLNPAGYHRLNVVLHVAVAWLLCGILDRTLRRAGRPPRQSLLLATAVATLWAVHPLATESVVCVIQRNELLASLFLLGTLYGFMRAVDSGGRAYGWQIASVASCVLGMASKETMVGAPILVLLYDRAFAAGTFGQALKARRGYYTALAASWALLAYLVMGNQERAGTVGFGLGASVWAYLVTQCHALALYLKLSIWPHPLVVDYGFELVHGLGAVWPEALLVLALVAVVFAGVARNRLWAFPGACFFLLLAPSSSILPLTTQTIAEHRMYLPLAAVVALCVLAAATVFRRHARWAAPAIALALILVTARRVETYRTEKSIWTDTSAKAPTNARAWSSLANLLVRENRWTEAATLYARAVQLRPDYADTQNDYANVLLHLGDAKAALTHYQEAHRLKPDDGAIEFNYARALGETGDLDGAIQRLQAIAAREPRNAAARNSLGDAWLKRNRPAEALTWFSEALALEPNSGATQNNVAVALMNLGRYADAVPHYEAALQQMPDSALIHHNLALALDGAGRLADSAREETEALRIDPTFTRAREHLAEVKARLDSTR